MMDNIIDAIRQPLLDVATEIHGSIVYLDAGAAEVAQLSFGPAFLFGKCLVRVAVTPCQLLVTQLESAGPDNTASKAPCF